ncbi:MAG: hypothetical protein AB1593_00730 [Pseudomonadota bacterium]
MFYKQKNQFQRWWFDRAIRGMYDTPAMAPSSDPGAPLVLSQLQHRDVLMYLAAIKSFARQVPVGGVHVLDDGSLTPQDHATLARHVPGVTLHRIVDFREPDLPAGGTWERLAAIARLSESRYVIQLDADTLSLDALPEVCAAVRDDASFSIGTWDGQQIEEVLERAVTARKHLQGVQPHVQVLAEAHFDHFESASTLRYVRGCSGFSGFAPGPGKLDLMRTLSARMQALIGARWMEWGSEQVMSNLVVANQPNAIVLPHPDYADCEKMQSGRTRFVHFIGTCRFRRGVYAGRVRQTLLNGRT